MYSSKIVTIVHFLFVNSKRHSFFLSKIKLNREYLYILIFIYTKPVKPLHYSNIMKCIHRLNKQALLTSIYTQNINFLDLHSRNEIQHRIQISIILQIFQQSNNEAIIVHSLQYRIRRLTRG